MNKKGRFKKLYLFVFALVLSISALAFNNVNVAQAATTQVSSSQIVNSSNRKYVNNAIEYYLKQSDVKSALNSNQAVVFFFEGASDKAQTIEDYNKSDSKSTFFNTRTSAVCVVIKKNSSGVPDIAFFNQNCSTLPCKPENGKATAKDGIYRIVAHNHKSRYAALQTQALVNGSYTASSIPAIRLGIDGNLYEESTASGINIHTRGSKKRSSWSEGCILVGYYSKDNQIPNYEKFLKAVYPSTVSTNATGGQLTDGGSYDNVILPKITSGTGTVVGTVVIDRFLYQDEMDVIYGNSKAVDAIVKFSVNAEKKMSATSTITVNATLAKTKITQGSSCNISGTVTSSSNITKILGQITTTSGSLVQSKSYNPGCKEVNLASSVINSGLKFGSLQPGSYKLTISATNKDSLTATKTISFTVVAKSKPSLSVSMATTTITKGKSCNITGTISSDFTITSVSGYILSTDGTKTYQAVEYNPNSTSVNIKNSPINNNLKFGQLSKGNYLLRVKAKNQYGTTTKTISFIVK